MKAVVIDASAGAEIVADTRRGRALTRLVPAGAEGWVPEHFYAEVLGVLRRRFLIEKAVTEEQATAAVARLRRWPLHQASIAPLKSGRVADELALVDSEGVGRLHRLVERLDAAHRHGFAQHGEVSRVEVVGRELRRRPTTPACVSVARRPFIERERRRRLAGEALGPDELRQHRRDSEAVGRPSQRPVLP
ncbi:MAG TPA: hypothetical protein VM142_15645 [Acidimicrobiales bacterium]|nr:hypothetical protein [Acidimicrobiales bacterium]